MKVVVIGAGVVGASVAYHLARRGARVECVERAQPAGGATAASFARTKVYGKVPRAYFELNDAAVGEHARLAADLGPGAWWHQCGGLIWGREPDAFVAHVEQLRGWGAQASLLAADEVVRRLEPGIVFPDADTPVAHFPREGWVDGPLLVRRILDAARGWGASLRTEVSVEAIGTSGGAVSDIALSDGACVRVDAVVNAAGPDADRIAAMAGVPLRLEPSAGVLVDVDVDGRRVPIARILQAPAVSLRPAGPGRLQVRADDTDDALASGAAQDGLANDLLERAAAVVPALKGAIVVDARVGRRAMPEGGLPVIGPAPGLGGYFDAVMHSGMNLGPLVGRLLAQQIVAGRVDPLLSPFSR